MSMMKLTKNQKLTMVSFFENNEMLGRNQFDKSLNRAKAKEKWAELTLMLNRQGGAVKDVKRWKKTWSDIKIESKRKALAARDCLEKNGEDSNDDDDDDSKSRGGLSEIDERVLSIIGGTSVECIGGMSYEHQGELDDDYLAAAEAVMVHESDAKTPPTPTPTVVKRSAPITEKSSERVQEYLTEENNEIESSSEENDSPSETRRSVKKTKQTASSPSATTRQQTDALTLLAKNVGRIADSIELLAANVGRVASSLEVYNNQPHEEEGC